MDLKTVAAIDQAITAAEQILSIEPWSVDPRFIVEPLITGVAIQLKDALIMLDRAGHRIRFKDDIEEGDVTDLVARFRNAACHIGSAERHVVPALKLGFAAVPGKQNLMEGPGFSLSNPYDDDIAFFYGKHRIFLRRHMLRAITEAKAALRLAAEADHPMFFFGR